MAAERIPVALSIAGSDPSGGAGVQGDLKTFSALGVYGAAAVTVLTVQNRHGVRAQLPVAVEFVVAQAQAVLDDLRVDVVKLGMLGSAATVRALAALLGARPQLPLVVDPVMLSTSGAVLLEPAGVQALIETLLPRATLLTPNLPEAAVLLDDSEAAVRADPLAACRRLLRLGVSAVLLKGGHGEGAMSSDLLIAGERVETLSAPRLATVHSHGTGCTLSSAIAAGLAHGLPLFEAAAAAKRYLHGALAAAEALNRAIRSGAEPPLGPAGHGPLHHFFGCWQAPPSPAR
jgi:hydroxymethylpyrimidine/phosphomethylpyrimidine kinase